MKLPKYLVLLIFTFFLLTFPLQTSFAKETIEETLGKINKTNLPLSVKIIPVGNTTVNTSSELQPLDNTSSQTANDTANINTAGQYSMAASGKTPEYTSNNFASFFARIIASIADFFDFGNKKATDYAGTQLPQEAVNKTVAQSSSFTSLSLTQTNNQQVLGIFDSNAMAKALPVLQCGNLPQSLCKNNSPFASPTPAVTSTAPVKR